MGRATFLLMSDFERLEEWCQRLRLVIPRAQAYLVGSAQTTSAYRDVDVRIILDDTRFDREYAKPATRVRMVNRAISIWGQQETGLPIDFQIQRRTEATAAFGDAPRNPMGTRDWSVIATSGTPVRVEEARESRVPTERQEP